MSYLDLFKMDWWYSVKRVSEKLVSSLTFVTFERSLHYTNLSVSEQIFSTFHILISFFVLLYT